MNTIFSKYFKLLLVVVAFFSNSAIFAFASDEDGNKPEETNPTPKMKMSGNGMATVEAGQSIDVKIPIVNTTQFYAYDLLIQPKTEKDAPFTLEILNHSNTSGVVGRVESINLFIRFNVDKNAPSGTYPVTLDYSYLASNKANFSGTDTFFLKVENKNGAPSVTLSNFKVSKEKILLGDSFSISANLENVGKVDVRNLNIQILGLEESNISLTSSTSNLYFEKYDVGYNNPLKFDFATTSLSKQGSNKITFKLSYNDISGKEYTREFQYYITMLKSGSQVDSQVNLSIANIVAPSKTLEVNEAGNFVLKIKNTGKSEAKNVKVTAKIPAGLVPNSSNTVVLPSILAGGEKDITFSVMPTSEAKTQAYSVGFLVEYGEQKESTTDSAFANSFEQYAGVKVNNPNPTGTGETEKKSTPKIIVSRYESSPMIVEAGQSFKLAMTFKNTHSTKTVQNIKIYLTVEDKTEEKGNVFAPDNSSTTFYISKIAPNQEISHTFNLFAVPDAKPRSYTINVNFEYEDESANEYKNSEFVGINVKQQAKFETSEINVPTEGYVNEPVYVQFQVYNTGKVTLSNFKISIEGKGIDTSSSTTFIGNIPAGGSEYYDASFTPTEEGQLDGKVLISCEDTDGRKIEFVKDFKLNSTEMVISQEPNSPNGEVMPEELPARNGKIFKIVLGVLVVLAIIGLVLFLYFRKRNRLKKEFDFNEED